MIPYKYTVIDISEDDEVGFKAVVPAFPSLYILADSVEELHKTLKELIKEEITHREKNNLPIPLPDNAQKYTGIFTTRIPSGLHRRISELAESQQTSMNKYVTELLEKGLAT